MAIDYELGIVTGEPDPVSTPTPVNPASSQGGLPSQTSAQQTALNQTPVPPQKNRALLTKDFLTFPTGSLRISI